MLQEGLRVTLLLLEGVALEVRDLDLFMFHSHTVPQYSVFRGLGA
jgi:hypothetical protein